MTPIVATALFLLLLPADLGSLASEEQYFITPSLNDPCPTNSCLTFDQFAANSTDVESNMTLYFLEGTHIIESGFIIKEVNVFSMQSISTSVSIICNSNLSVRMQFIGMGTLHIKGLNFIGCSGNKIKDVEKFILEDSNFIGEGDNVTGSGTPLELIETSATFIRSKFSFNSGNKIRSLPCAQWHYDWNISKFYLDTYYLDNTRQRVGGAILSTHSNLTIMSSTFEGNSAQAGGAIYAELQSNVTIISSHFVENHATFIRSEYDCYYGGGGVLYVDSNRTSVITIESSTFEYNSGNWYGGVIALGLSTDHAVVTISNSDFVSNRAQNSGGVLDLANSKSVSVVILGSKFLNNSAKYGGAVNAVDTKAAIINISNSTFSNNSALQEAGVLDASHAENTLVTITNCKFVGNHVTFDRAGVVDVTYSQNATVNILSCEFIGNKAEGGGGVMDVSYTQGMTVRIAYSKFEYNSAKWFDGGAVNFWDSSNLTITIIASNFNKNMAKNGGGAIGLSHDTNVSLIISESNFTGNNARETGGAVNAVDAKSAIIDVSNSTFSNNSALQEAGVLDTSHAENTLVTLTNSRFVGNHVTFDRAGVVDVTYSQNATVNILSCEFIGNKAEGGGGVMDVSYTRGMTVRIAYSKFEYNSAKRYDGGAVNFWDSSNLTITIKASNFDKNMAKSGGGAIGLSHDANASLIISESNFTGNYAREAGALYCIARRHLSKVVIVGSVFQNNSATSDGGVLRTRSFGVEVATSLFVNNRAGVYGGTIMSTNGGEIVMRDSQFYNNRASFGGIVCARRSTVKAFAIASSENLAETDGGVFHTHHSGATIIGGSFSHNKANNNGGIMSATSAVTTIINATIDQNSAGNDGGVIRSHLSEVKIYGSHILSNEAENSGGVFCNEHSNLTTIQTSFTGNRANTGGVLQAELGISTLDRSLFFNNTAHTGGVMHIIQSTVNSRGSNITKNSALISTVYLSDSTAVFSKLDFSNNVGTLLAFGSSLTIADNSHLMRNKHPTQWTNIRVFFEGGAITAFQSDLVLNGTCELRKNEAEDGGAIKAIESKIHVHGNVMVKNNIASKTGGGIYLHFSELTSFKSSALNLIGNSASNKGGGICAIGSSIKVKESSIKQKSTLHFAENRAEKGGGLHIKKNSKLYIIKLKPDIAAHNKIITFIGNSADFGGAIHASDDGMCSLFVNSTRNECFFQTLAMYGVTTRTTSESQCHNIFFFNNSAKISGHSLFGGLLDSCKINPFAESVIRNDITNRGSWTNDASLMRGHKYFKKISNINDSDISSHPVRVCFCRNGNPDCAYQPDPIHIRRGKERKIKLSVAIVDQIGRPIRNAALYSHLGSGNDVCQNHIQKINGNCSDVGFAIFSNNNTEELILSLGKGPCKRSKESKARATLEFSCLECPIGFELDVTREGCQCVCDSQLFPFFTNCSGDVLVRERNVWIANFVRGTAENSSTNSNQYLIHPFCPLNYCHPPSSRVQLNLNMPNGVNAQCADNRSGLLCGTCQPGLSLSLGSSRCLNCSSHWLAILIVILIAAFLAGILLVVALLVLNLTVAVGTLNGIIFYANIVAANASIYLPSSCPNFITVFISWLNLEIGFDTCFFEGMNAYWKTLVQLIFPLYVILLVIMIIIISETSSRFAKLIGKRNPVATLATLILLCYAKLLHIINASLSFTVLHYPDGSQQIVWLPDATVPYLKGKHIALFGIAMLILMVGVAFTALLLLWQWLLRLQNVKLFQWMNYQKLCHFIEPYHAPYTFKYRYWTGLLLFICVVLYLVSAVNVEGDPRVTLVANTFVVGCLLLMKGVVQKSIYKKWPVDILETIMYFNILAFSVVTWYNLDSDKSQGAVACTSVMITFFLLLSVIFFHIYKYTALGSIIKHNHTIKWILAYVQSRKMKDNPKGEGELAKPTHSVVEIYEPNVVDAYEDHVTY